MTADAELESGSPEGTALQLLAALPVALFFATRAPNFFVPLLLQNGSRISRADANGIFSLCLLASLVILVILIILRERMEGILSDTRGLSLAACFCGFVGYLLLYLLVPADLWTTAGFVIGLLCVATYCSLYIIVIGRILTAFNLKGALSACALAGICFTAVHLLGLASIPRDVLFVFVIGAPLIIGLLSHFALIRIPEAREASAREGDVLFFLRKRGDSFGEFFIASVVFCIAVDVYTKLLSNVGTAAPSGERAITLYVCLVAFVSVYFILRSAAVTKTTLLGIFSFFAVIFIGSLMFTVIMNYRGSTWLGTGAIQSCELLFLFFSLMLATDAVKEHGQPCITIFGIFGVFVVLLPNILAHGLVVSLGSDLEFYASEMVIPVTAMLSLLALLALCLVVFLSLRQRSRDNEERKRSRSFLACEDVGADHGLTEREIEIMRYIYQGHSIKKIAELSSIAPSTVQGHMKKIYAKLGVHARQELIDMVNARRDSPERP